MWEEHEWVFDLVSDDELRRRRARNRAHEFDNALIAANQARNDVYWRAGGTFTPDDPVLAADMERAEASLSAAHAKTFHAPISAYLTKRWDPGWKDRAAADEPFAVLFLEWERALPVEWRQTAGRRGSACGSKEVILMTMADHGVGQPHIERVSKLVLATVRGPYRAKDWRYTRVARRLDGRALRDGLGAIATGDDPAAALRAEFVLSRLDNPDLSANRRSYGNWLKESDER